MARKVLIAICLLTTAIAPAYAFAAREIVQNPLLTQNRDGKPRFWKEAAYKLGDSAAAFSWSVGDDLIGVLRIENKVPNDARYVQTVTVSPNTWYNVSGWGRAEKVGRDTMGLYLSVMGTFHNSRDLRGTVAWQPLSFWVKTGSLETSLDIACRLGGYSSLNTGTGWCTGISVTAAGTPNPDSRFVYGTVEQSSSNNKFWVQAAAVLIVLGSLLLLWRYIRPPSQEGSS